MPIARFAGIAVTAALALATANIARADASIELRIGFQKYGTLTLVKARQTLKARFAPLGMRVSWREFPAGPQLLEALNVGSVDFGATDEAPPVFAQAAGAPIVYVGQEPPSPEGEAILVPADSAIHSVSDLAGRKIALNRGSNVHYLLVRALAAHSVAQTDIQPVYLPPADARAAFERGAVDAWAIWDPFLIVAQRATGARILTDGTGLVRNHQFYLAARGFAEDHPQVIRAMLAELRDTAGWLKESRGAAAEILAGHTDIEAAALEIALARMNVDVQPLDDEVVAEQQRIVDTFHELGLIPRAIQVREAVWTAGSQGVSAHSSWVEEACWGATVLRRRRASLHTASLPSLCRLVLPCPH